MDTILLYFLIIKNKYTFQNQSFSEIIIQKLNHNLVDTITLEYYLVEKSINKSNKSINQSINQSINHIQYAISTENNTSHFNI
jgi:predicted flavoprotein YhiN